MMRSDRHQDFWADEKAALQQGYADRTSRMRSRRPALRFLLLAPVLTTLLVLQGYYFRHDVPNAVEQTSSQVLTSQCPAQLSISPKKRPDLTEKNVNDLFKSVDFRNESARRLGGAVKVPTENFDDLGEVGQDPRWDVFYDFQDYLKETFPFLHEKLNLATVHTHGLVYTWTGSDSSLKPILLTAHQDAVPVAADTLEQWEYPPFSGHFDGEYVYGRGAGDCKNNLIGLLSAVTALLEQDFEPHRTVVLAFGFDEETSGYAGARYIGEYLEDKWGKDSFAILVDEGVTGIQKSFGRTFGIPQTSEKGYLDMSLQVHLPGGHSSMPPPHTSIGILAEAVKVLEDSAAVNFPRRLSSNNPFYYQLQCAAEDPSTDIPSELRDALLDPNGTDKVLELLADDPKADILIHTSQAVTIFNSGSKVNALPAYAEAKVNFRVSNEETLADVKEILTNTLKPVTEKHGLDFYVYEENDAVEKLPEYAFSVTWHRDLDPSPVSSTESDVWTYFSGVIKHVFDEEGEGNDVLVAPMIAQGNTDTKHYWSLTSQIYRFGPYRAWHDNGWGGVHDVNERASIYSHLEVIEFFHELIRVFDEADLE